MTKTTVFQSGKTQAVRLPKEFRFSGRTVEIFRRGNEVVLRERPRTMAELVRNLPVLDASFPDDIPDYSLTLVRGLDGHEFARVPRLKVESWEG